MRKFPTNLHSWSTKEAVPKQPLESPAAGNNCKLEPRNTWEFCRSNWWKVLNTGPIQIQYQCLEQRASENTKKDIIGQPEQAIGASASPGPGIGLQWFWKKTRDWCHLRCMALESLELSRTLHLLIAHLISAALCTSRMQIMAVWPPRLARSRRDLHKAALDRSELTAWPCLATILQLGKTTFTFHHISPDGKQHGTTAQPAHHVSQHVKTGRCQLSNDSRLSSIWARRTAERYPSRRHMSLCDKHESQCTVTVPCALNDAEW